MSDNKLIQELPGVGAATAEKLLDAGFDTLMAIAVATPGELTELVGMGETAAKRVINAARQRLDMGFESGEDLLKRREQVIKITTGAKGFDTLLGGGFETGSISECFGEFGCVAADTYVTLADGSMQTFAEIAQGRPAGEYELELPITTWFNNATSKIMTKRLFIYNCPELTRIILKDGREIKVTPNHPLMTQEGWKRAEHLKEGELLVVNWPEQFPEKKVQLQTKVTLHEKAPKTRIKKVNLPQELDENLAKIIGYQLAEGWKEKGSKNGGVTRVSFGSSDERLLTCWKKTVEEAFQIKVAYRKKEENTTTYAIDSVMVGEYLRQFGGLYERANQKTIPAQILQSPKEIVIAFLATFYDGEGCVKLERGKALKKAKWRMQDGTIKEKVYYNDKKGKSVELRSSSKILLQQVQLLLGKMKIKTSITEDETKGKKCYKLHIYRELYISRFYENIGKKTIRLKEKIEQVLKEYTRDIKTRELNVITIKKIEKVENKEGKVYDIEVPQTHSFLANNIVSHNSSKTQIAHILACAIQLPKEQGGADGMAVYIDGEGAFRPERIIQFAKGFNLDPQEVLKKIKVARAFNSDHQMLLAEKVEDLITKEKLPIKLVIVDSLTAHFRAEFVGRGTLAERQQKLNKHMHVLAKIASVHNLCVYVTNQVMARPDTFFGDPTTAIGGNIVGHNSQSRIYLRKGKKGTRVAKLIDSPHLPDGETIFEVTENGLKDA